MSLRKVSKLFSVLALLTLGACATNPNAYRVKAIDAPTFEDTKIIALQASDIRVINKYGDKKLSGDNGHNYAVDPSEVFEEYLQTRFQATGKGEPITFVIDQSSLIYNREVANAGGQDDNVYALEFKVRALSGGTLEEPENQATIKIMKALRQRRGTLTNEQKANGQIRHLSETIAAFDKKLFRALGLESARQYDAYDHYGYGYGRRGYGRRGYGYHRYGHGYGGYRGSYGHRGYGYRSYGHHRY